MTHEPKLEKYGVYVKLTVWGESPEDAIDYANTAIDASDLLTQDGIIGVELIDDADSAELLEGNDYDDEDDEDY